MSDVARTLADVLADRYRVDRELGAGGMATVYLAEDLRHHRQVAIKVLKPELDPMVLIWEPTNGIALREMGRLDDAAQVFLDFQRTFQQPSVNLAVTYGRMGKRDEALRVIHEIEARERKQWVDPDFLAIAYAGVGDNDRVIDWLETAFREKAFSLRAFLNWDMPWLRPLRDDPRFINLKRRVLATTFRS
jgi:hypothetical protein